jgi:hypothetical protein
MQTDGLKRWQAQYDSFFDGLSLAAVDDVYWPIYEYTLTANLRQTTGLDALEEGLLRLVEAGICSVDELARLLGCSRAYVETMGRYLRSGITPYIKVVGETWSATPATKDAIAARERTILVPEDHDLLRDGLFGFWLSRGDERFTITKNPSSETSPSHWLGPLVERDIGEQEFGDSCRLTLRTFGADAEVHSYHASRSGNLGWVALRLLYFQSADKKVGRVLLLNPESEDRPLDELSFQFEQQLRTGEVPLYFPDDSLKTGSSFWESLATSAVGFSTRESVTLIENDLNETRQELQIFKAKHQNSETARDSSGRFADALRIVEQTNSDGNSPQERENEDVICKYEEAIAVRDVELQRLLDKIAILPTSQLLESREHPPLLRQAIREAKQSLIVISPWIKMIVLRPLLPELDALLARGCEVWIGYGMPKNKRHQDASDPDAIRALQERERSGMLHLVEMITHEKVLIVDDLLFAISSFNWLSFRGGDGRRESGILLRGRLSQMRDRFLTDMRKKSSKVLSVTAGSS